MATWSLTTELTGSHRATRLRYSQRAALLLLEAGRGDAETADAAVGGVELGARRRHGDPHRRMRILHRLGQDRSLGHRHGRSSMGDAFLGPQARQQVHVLVPGDLGRVRVDTEATELGPGGGPRRAELEAPAGQDVEHRRPLGDSDRVVHLWHADDCAVPDTDPLGLHGHGREEQLRRRAVRVLLEEVMFDRPHRVEAELVGQPRLLERVAVDGLLGRPRASGGPAQDARIEGKSANADHVGGIENLRANAGLEFTRHHR